MQLDETTGLCSCEDGYHMHPTHGCLKCDYMIPGCRTCSEAYWNTGISLDTIRMYGPDVEGCNSAKYLTCDQCELAERFVQIELDDTVEIDDFDYEHIDYANLPDGIVPLTPMRCASCHARYEGCSQCGIFGEACDKCSPTHVLEAIDPEGVIPCTRCDIFMADCLTCYSRSSCKQEKPKMLI